MPDEKIDNTLEIIYNEKLPAVFIDAFAIARRKDNVFLLHLLTEVPTQYTEEYRAVVPDESINALIDLLCRNTGYYPAVPTS